VAASYPSSVRVFTTKSNLTDIVDASHPNFLQEEVIAIESTLGVTPGTSTTPNPVNSFTATSTAYTTLVQRLANIETGIVSDSHSQYIRKTSDASNVIVAGSASIKPIVVKGASSQSANLLEFQDSSGTVLSSFGSDGVFSGTATALDLTLNPQAGTAYPLIVTDKNKLITLSNSNPITLTVPANASEPFPIGSQVNLLQTSTGQVTVSPVNGTVTINGVPGLKLRTQWAAATLIKIATDSWVLVGDLSA
jgi:hypothetical protein